jgi:hypothetical protein
MSEWHLCDSGMGQLLAIQAASAGAAKRLARQRVAEALAAAAASGRVIRDLVAAGHELGELGSIPAVADPDRLPADCARIAEEAVIYIAGPVRLRVARECQEKWSQGDREPALKLAAPYVRRRWYSDLRAVYVLPAATGDTP